MFDILVFVIAILQLAIGQEQNDFGVTKSLTNLKARAYANPADFAVKLRSAPFAGVFKRYVNRNGRATSAIRSSKSSSTGGNGLPLVFLHGMGDSCFNRGMESITEESGAYMGVYSVCIPTGVNRTQDTLNGFFMSMDESVDVFAAAVSSDPQLANGFNCIGLSQGNNICRGYVQRYNNPKISTHLSIHGPIVGVASLPSCPPDSDKIGSLCQSIDDILGKFAYNDRVQDFLFQAGYFREINYVDGLPYKKYSEIARWNNEGLAIDPSMNSNFAKTDKFAMIKANGDTVVVPREAEWFGQFDSSYNVVVMKDTAWYKYDLFGLKTADEAGKLFFNTTEGNHLDFTDEELFSWLDLYC